MLIITHLNSFRPSSAGRKPTVSAEGRPVNPSSLPTPLLAVFQNVYPNFGQMQLPTERDQNAVLTSGGVPLKPTQIGIRNRPCLRQVDLTVQVQQSAYQRERAARPPLVTFHLSSLHIQRSPHSAMRRARQTAPLYRPHPHPHRQWIVGPSWIPHRCPQHRHSKIRPPRQHSRCSNPPERQHHHHKTRHCLGLIRPNRSHGWKCVGVQRLSCLKRKRKSDGSGKQGDGGRTGYAGVKRVGGEDEDRYVLRQLILRLLTRCWFCAGRTD
jgi:hypothetical protein